MPWTQALPLQRAWSMSPCGNGWRTEPGCQCLMLGKGGNLPNRTLELVAFAVFRKGEEKCLKPSLGPRADQRDGGEWNLFSPRCSSGVVSHRQICEAGKTHLQLPWTTLARHVCTHMYRGISFCFITPNVISCPWIPTESLNKSGTPSHTYDTFLSTPPLNTPPPQNVLVP